MGIEYKRGGDVVEIIIRDSSGAKIEHHTCQINDKKKYSSILRYLKDKYGFEPEIKGTEAKEEIDWWK